MADLLVVSGIGIPDRAIEFRTSRSSGPGGQNVNKLDTRVELMFDPDVVPAFSSETRSLIRSRLHRRLDRTGRVRIVVQKHRSQWKNKQEALDVLAFCLEEALRVRLVRKATKPSLSSKRKRIAAKSVRGEVKRQRRRPVSGDDD